jgi:transposase
MGRQRREFTPEYKDEAVKLVINTGRAVAVVARELGVQESTLGRWVNAFKARQDAGDGALSETGRAELARLRKENSELKMDRAFLKKASVNSTGQRNTAVSLGQRMIVRINSGWGVSARRAQASVAAARASAEPASS